MGSGISVRLNYVSILSGATSGNESEDTIIPFEDRSWDCEIKLRRNRASEADQRDYPGKRLELR